MTIITSRTALLYALNTIGKGFDQKTLAIAKVIFEGSVLHMADYKLIITVNVGCDFTPVLTELGVKRAGVGYTELLAWLSNLYKTDEITVSQKGGTMLFKAGRNNMKYNVDGTVMSMKVVNEGKKEIICVLPEDDLVHAFAIQELRTGKVASPLLENVLLDAKVGQPLVTYAANGFVFGKSIVKDSTCDVTKKLLVNGDVLRTCTKIKWATDVTLVVNTIEDTSGKGIFNGGIRRSVQFTDGVVTVRTPIGTDADTNMFPIEHIDKAVTINQDQFLFDVPSGWLTSELSTFNQAARASSLRVPCNIWTYTDDTGTVNIATSTQLAGKLDIEADVTHKNAISLPKQLVPPSHIFACVEPSMVNGLVMYLSKQVDIKMLQLGRLDAVNGLLLTTEERTDYVGCALMSSKTYL